MEPQKQFLTDELTHVARMDDAVRGAVAASRSIKDSKTIPWS
jgi:hypothetical protein